MLFITLDNICYSNIKTFLSNSEWDIVMATTNLFKIVYKFTRFIKLNKKYSELYNYSISVVVFELTTVEPECVVDAIVVALAFVVL